MKPSLKNWTPSSRRSEARETASGPNGRSCQKGLVFEFNSEKILDAGDKVTAKHLTQVQKIVQKNLETIEGDMKDQRAREWRVRCRVRLLG